MSAGLPERHKDPLPKTIVEYLYDKYMETLDPKDPEGHLISDYLEFAAKFMADHPPVATSAADANMRITLQNNDQVLLAPPQSFDMAKSGTAPVTGPGTYEDGYKHHTKDKKLGW
jgi:hypothetical protein